MTKVRFEINSRSSLSAYEQIRDQVINYVHLGLLASGERLPPIRELAAQTGLNLKTVFRIYRKLERDELAEIRPQCGVFIKCSAPAARRSYQVALRGLARRVLREAQQVNLSPFRFLQLLAMQTGLEHPRSLRCAVLECNREQTHLFSAELRRKLKVDAFPVFTNSSPQRRERALRQADVFITTDFHQEEVSRWAARHRKEVYRIRLNPKFLRLLVSNARRGVFPMVLTDVSFEPRFRRAMAGTVPGSVGERLVLVHYRNRGRLRQLLAKARRAYVSPLCYTEVAKIAPKGVRLLTLQDMISSESLRTLRRSLFLAFALRGRDESSGA
jgi:GntR family transcriptional regulator